MVKKKPRKKAGKKKTGTKTTKRLIDDGSDTIDSKTMHLDPDVDKLNSLTAIDPSLKEHKKEHFEKLLDSLPEALFVSKPKENETGVAKDTISKSLSEEDVTREQYAALMYDQNIRLLTEKVRKNVRCMYCVILDNNGIILEISPCKIVPPQSDRFTFYVPGDFKEPRFGSFNALSDFRLKVAEHLKKDMNTLLQRVKLAYASKAASEAFTEEHKTILTVSQKNVDGPLSEKEFEDVVAKSKDPTVAVKQALLARSSTAIQGDIKSMTERFGELPVPSLQARCNALEEEAALVKQEQQEKDQVWEEEIIDFDTLLKQELRENHDQNVVFK